MHINQLWDLGQVSSLLSASVCLSAVKAVRLIGNLPVFPKSIPFLWKPISEQRMEGWAERVPILCNPVSLCLDKALGAPSSSQLNKTQGPLSPLGPWSHLQCPQSWYRSRPQGPHASRQCVSLGPPASALCALERSLDLCQAENSLHGKLRARCSSKPCPECVLARMHAAERKCLFSNCELAGRPPAIHRLPHLLCPGGPSATRGLVQKQHLPQCGLGRGGLQTTGLATIQSTCPQRPGTLGCGHTVQPPGANPVGPSFPPHRAAIAPSVSWPLSQVVGCGVGAAGHQQGTPGLRLASAGDDAPAGV